MDTKTFLETRRRLIAEHIERGRALTDGLSDEDLSKSPEPGVWGVGQILEHMTIGTASYVPVLKSAIAGAPDGNSEVSHTWFGKVIIKACQPESNAPAPKTMRPTKTTYTRKTVDEWIAAHEGVLDVIDGSRGRDVCKVPFRTPFLKLFKMNVADAIEIVNVHALRHLGQIEERLPKIKG